jgi:hypothetical protein
MPVAPHTVSKALARHFRKQVQAIALLCRAIYPPIFTGDEVTSRSGSKPSRSSGNHSRSSGKQIFNPAPAGNKSSIPLQRESHFQIIPSSIPLQRESHLQYRSSGNHIIKSSNRQTTNPLLLSHDFSNRSHRHDRSASVL